MRLILQDDEILSPRLYLRDMRQYDENALEMLLRDDGFDYPYMRTLGATPDVQAHEYAGLAEKWNTIQPRENCIKAITKMNAELIGAAVLAHIEEGDPLFAEADCDNHLEIGYFIKQTEQGNGYATEAMLYMMQYAQETMDAKGVWASIAPYKPKSIKVAERLGLRLVATRTPDQVKYTDPQGKPVGRNIYFRPLF